MAEAKRLIAWAPFGRPQLAVPLRKVGEVVDEQEYLQRLGERLQAMLNSSNPEIADLTTDEARQVFEEANLLTLAWIRPESVGLDLIAANSQVGSLLQGRGLLPPDSPLPSSPDAERELKRGSVSRLVNEVTSLGLGSDPDPVDRSPPRKRSSRPSQRQSRRRQGQPQS